MSIRLMSRVWDLPLPDSQKLVLLALADCANDEGVAWPSIATLCRKATRSERTVQGVLRELEDSGHITRDQVSGKGCLYMVHPRSGCAPAEDAPPQRLPDTPAAVAPKPSRTINIPQKASPSSGARKGTRVPQEFWPNVSPDSATGKAMADWPPGEIEEQVEHFIDHHTAKGTVSLDWQASWRTWVKLGKRYNGKRPANDRAEHQNPLFRAAFGASGFSFAD